MKTIVHSLISKEIRVYDLPPRQAVMAAHAQSIGDYNTWDYGKYEKDVITGKISVACGNYGALLNQGFDASA